MTDGKQPSAHAFTRLQKTFRRAVLGACLLPVFAHAQTAGNKADKPVAAAGIYPARFMMRETPERCVRGNQPEASVPDSLKPLQQNIARMRDDAWIGAKLAVLSERRDVIHCLTRVDEDVEGLWDKKTGIVTVSHASRDNHPSLLLTQVHELIHVQQTALGLDTVSANHGIFYLQMSMLAMEAAAEAGSFLLASELNLGSTHFSAPLRMAASYNPMGVYAVAAVFGKRAIRGESREDALIRAGTAAWRDHFENQRWLDFYNGRLLSSFIDDLQQRSAAPHGVFTVAMARKSGEMPDGFNFLADLDSLPDMHKRFGRNGLMRQAFERAELEHLHITLGPAHARTKDLRAKLEETRNPYLSLDLADVRKAMQEQKIPALTVMNCAARAGICPGSAQDSLFRP